MLEDILTIHNKHHDEQVTSETAVLTHSHLSSLSTIKKILFIKGRNVSLLIPVVVACNFMERPRNTSLPVAAFFPELHGPRVYARS